MVTKKISDSDIEGIKTPTPHPTPYKGVGGWGDYPRKVPLEILKEAVENLTKSDRKELADHIRYLDSNRQPTKGHDVAADRDMRLWGDALAKELFRITREGSDKFPATPSILTALEGGYQVLLAFNSELGISDYQSTERAAWYRLVARLLVSHCRTTFVNAPLAMKYILPQSNLIPALVEAAYPGYARAGLIRVLIAATDPERCPF